MRFMRTKLACGSAESLAGRTLRRVICWVVAVIVGIGASGAVSPAQTDPPYASTYAHSAQLIDVGGGRKLNLVCMGQGSPTVLFEAGVSDWSSKWVLVQPAVARRVRACSYDRAGMGFSDPEPAHFSLRNFAADLHALVHAAPIATPFVLVGHSMGGGLALLYTELYPQDVSGLVLVDPWNAYFFSHMNDATHGKFAAMHLAHLASYRACVQQSASEVLTPGTALFEGCTDPERPPMGPTLIAARHAVEVTSSYQQAQLQDLTTLITTQPTELNTAARNLGPLPLTVITTGRVFPDYGIGSGAESRMWYASHSSLAARSSRSIHLYFPKQPHNIILTQPSAVIDAISAILDRLHVKPYGTNKSN